MVIKLYTEEGFIMNQKILQTTTNLSSPSDVHVSVNMSQCSYIKTESKTVTISANLKDGAQMQYFSDKKTMRNDFNI